MNARKILTGAAAIAILVVVLGGILHRGPAPAKRRGNMGGQIGGGFVPPTKPSGGGGGDITDVVAGSGLTGGASSGAATVDVGCGTGLSCAADTVAIANGDRGDVSITGEGATWDLDTGVVGTNELADDLDLSANGFTTIGDTRGKVQTYSMTSGVVNDLAANSDTTVLRIASSGNMTATGFTATGRGNGSLMVVQNPGNFVMTLTNEGAASVAANRILTPASATWQVAAGGAALFAYDSAAARWRLQMQGGSRFPTLTSDGTINGSTNLTVLSGTATFNTASFGFTPTGQATDVGSVRITNTGTYNATAAARTSYGMHLDNTATRSAGANNVTNVGIQASASGAQVNYAARFGAGFVVLDTASPGMVDLSTAPTFTSCGTSPTATTGGAHATTITMGSGAPTTCALTFSTTYSNAPTCQVTSRSSARQDVYLSAVSTTGVTISNVAAATMASIVVDLICVGH